MVDKNGVNGWTPTQRRLHDVLKDGEPHSLAELLGLMPDPRAAEFNYRLATAALTQHIVKLRKRLALGGLDLICQRLNRRSHYRIMRSIAAAE